MCIKWDRNKSIWALRILSEVLLCTGIVACVAAFTIEQGKPNIYFLVSGLVLFLFAAIGLASSFCLSHDGKKNEKFPVYTVTLPSPVSSLSGSLGEKTTSTQAEKIRTVSSITSSDSKSNDDNDLEQSYRSSRPRGERRQKRIPKSRRRSRSRQTQKQQQAMSRQSTLSQLPSEYVI